MLKAVPDSLLFDPREVVSDDRVVTDGLDKVAARALELGLKRVHVLARRDFEAPLAGGSELYADKIASIWARCGLDVTLLTGAGAGLGRKAQRNGYDVIRRAGRVAVIPRTALRGAMPHRHAPDGLMEIWQGMPFFLPLWARCPRITFVHHVNGAAWRSYSGATTAKVGEFMELKVAPRVYRGSRLVTACHSARADIASLLGLDPGQVTVVPHGVDERFSPGGVRSSEPLIVAVGRLAPVKRFDLLIDSLVEVRRRVPRLRAAIIGEGPERLHLEAKIHAAGASDWIDLPGRLPADELVEAYRRAWAVASVSSRQAWNLTISEAAACGTPAVASDIVGNRDVVWHGVSGLLVGPNDDFAAALVRVLQDDVFRGRLGRGALERSNELNWDASAAGTLAALVEDAEARL